jgi:hypothetical protein
LMESIQRIMIRTQIFRHRLPSNRTIEHPTERYSVNDTRMNSESDNAPRVLIHNDEHPLRAQCHRFTSEQIDAVKATTCALLRRTDKLLSISFR